jgi:hypothetical protein
MYSSVFGQIRDVVMSAVPAALTFWYGSSWIFATVATSK